MPTDSRNKRIAKNTFLLYIRMLVMLGISLYTSRIILNALGFVDMGIYNVVGSIVLFISFINNSMSIAVQRFLTFDLGKNDKGRLNKTFNISISTHLLIALLIFIIAESFGLIFLDKILNIPPDKLNAAIFVFHISIITCCIGIVKVPFNAIIIAHEKMGIFAYLSIFEVCIALAIALTLPYIGTDRLKAYAVMMMLSSLFMTTCYCLYCFYRFRDIRFKIVWENKIFKQLIGFASWSAFGELAWVFTNQGVNFVLNIFFGPVVNTARGISYQIQSALMRFVSNFQTAINPQITKRYAAGEIENLYNLVFRSTCFSYYMMLFLSLPVILEIHFLLGIWLGEFPPYTAIFCQLILINSLIDIISNLLASVVKAYGKIRKYQIVVSSLLMLNLPLSYITLKFGAPAYTTFLIYGIISATLIVTRLYLLREMIDFPVKHFIKRVIFKLLSTTIFIVPIPIFIEHIQGNDNITKFIITSLTSVFCTAFIVYRIGLESNEKEMIKNNLKRIFHR